MFESKYQKIRTFNDKIIKLKVLDEALQMTPERMQWFQNVVKEEMKEFHDAWVKNDEVGMLDALVDVTYFIIGRVYECGFSEVVWDKAFAAVHEANMHKLKGNKHRGSDDDAIKLASWVGPEEKIKEILAQRDEEKKCGPTSDEAPQYMAPISYDANRETPVEEHKPSVYVEESGEQAIFDMDDLRLFANMSPVFKEVTKIAMRKSEDYNDGQNKPATRSVYFPFGLLSYAQMLHVKSQRLNSLAKRQGCNINNESIRDTLLDLINYATFAVEAIDKGELDD